MGCIRHRSAADAITLQTGFHGIKVEYFQASGVFQLEVKYQPPSGVKQVVPDTILYPCAPDPKIRKWFLEKDPYSKVEAMDANGDGVYEGWIITTPEGKKLKYGNLDLPGDRKATRYTLAWNDHIGDIKYATSSTTMPALYPYQWDMSEIADPVGNTLGFYYYQETKSLQFQSWTSSVRYTQASYLSSIVSPTNGHVDFIKSAVSGDGAVLKDPREYQDYRWSTAQSSGSISMHEKLLLSDIRVYSAAGQFIRQFHFDYKKINANLTGKFLKSLLTAISERDGNGKLLSECEYEYYDDFECADDQNTTKYDVNYNYGALKTRRNGWGGAESFEYTRKVLKNAESKEFENSAWIIRSIQSGMLSSGNPYVLCQEGRDNGEKMMVFNWDGANWVKQDYLPLVPC